LLTNSKLVERKRVCFFGSYENGELVNILINNFKKKNIEVIECQEDVYSLSQLIKAYFKLLLKRPKKKYSAMIIPWRGIMTLPLAKMISKGPIIFFPYLSIYDTLVNDRKKFAKNSIQAKFIQWVEKKACEISDVVVLDNDETIDYFCNEYKLDKKKFAKIIWTADERKFPPLPTKIPTNEFRVLYFGTFIPFHGVEVIIESAKILFENKDIQFVLCGDGQTRKENENLAKKYKLKNVNFLGHVKFSVLKMEIEDADVGLGVFGGIERRKNSFPNKIFQVLSSKKSLITRDVPVMKEINLKNKFNCILVQPNNHKELSEAILMLKNNPELNKTIAIEGNKTFKKISEESWESFYSDVIEKIL